MAESKYFLVRVSGASVVSSYLTLSEVAYHCGLHPELVERLVRLGLIDYAGTSGRWRGAVPR